jgi:hypothetical protein
MLAEHQCEELGGYFVVLLVGLLGHRRDRGLAVHERSECGGGLLRQPGTLRFIAQTPLTEVTDPRPGDRVGHAASLHLIDKKRSQDSYWQALRLGGQGKKTLVVCWYAAVRLAPALARARFSVGGMPVMLETGTASMTAGPAEGEGADRPGKAQQHVHPPVQPLEEVVRDASTVASRTRAGRPLPALEGSFRNAASCASATPSPVIEISQMHVSPR